MSEHKYMYMSDHASVSKVLRHYSSTWLITITVFMSEHKYIHMSDHASLSKVMTPVPD